MNEVGKSESLDSCGSKTRNATQLITPSTIRQAMSNPEGSLEELATSSRVGEATTLLGLPPELILHIASQLEVRDLLALRKMRFELEKLKSPQAHQAKTE